jgi:membrane peptidoglycan carboxypeptidase
MHMDERDPAGPDEDAQARRLPRWAQRALVLVGAVLLALLMVGPAVGLAARSVEVDASALPSLEERSVVLDADEQELAILHDEVDRQIVTLDELPEHVIGAIVAAEDRRFYSHGGYDVRGVARAAVANLRAGEIEQGASTITQQVAQMAFLGRERTSVRKVSEILHAVAIERELDKDEILERYVNAVYFGSGAYGISAAAEQYFRVPAADLEPEQAALLAGLIRAPEGLNPREHPEAAVLRRDWVLQAMGELGYLDADEAQRLQDTALDVEDRLRRETEEPYVVEAVKREFAGLEAFGDDAEQRTAALMSGGLRVHTTLDSDLQDEADVLVGELLDDEDGPTAALVALDPRSGAIRALHGGADFAEAQFDLATQGRRQPGSALKPFVALAAIEAGFAPDGNLVGGSPITFGADEVSSWEVSNYGDRDAGTVDLATAMARSTNTSFAQLAMTVGVEQIVDVAERLGIDAEAAFGESDTWGPSMGLGGITHGVTPLELAAAYGAFADQGRMGPAYLIERVTTAEGEVVYERGNDDRQQVIEPAVNTIMVELLRGVVTSGTGEGAALPDWQVLGKTGTTQEGADAWFVGATSQLSAAVWVGHPEGQVPMEDMTGGSLPARLWQQLAAAALDGVAPQPLPAEDGRVPDGDSVTVPDLSGMALGDALVAAAEAGVVALPPEGAGENPDVTVGGQDPSAGSAASFGDPVTLRLGGASTSESSDRDGSDTQERQPQTEEDESTEEQEEALEDGAETGQSEDAPESAASPEPAPTEESAPATEEPPADDPPPDDGADAGEQDAEPPPEDGEG